MNKVDFLSVLHH